MSSMFSTLAASATNASSYVLAQAPAETPVGPDFGKASPVGLLIIVVLAVAILALGFAFHRRFSRFRRRQQFAQAHGIDPFDTQALNQAMQEAGVLDRSKKHIF